MVAALSLLAVSIACYSVSQLQQHGKLRFSDDKKPFGFWGKASHVRKYRHAGGYRDVASRTLYYRLIGSPCIEAWPTSTWLTVSVTDSYHLLQSLSFLSMAGCVSLLSGIPFYFVWVGIIFVHALIYKLLSK